MLDLYRRSFLTFSIFWLLVASQPVHATEPVTAPITIAAIFAHTGKAMYSDRPAIIGTRFAVEEINRKGGIDDRPLQLLEIDNKSTPIGSHFAALKAVDENVTAIIGASWSSHSLAIARVAQENETVMISPSSTVPELTAIGDYIFRVCYNDNFQGKALASFAINDLKLGNAIIFTDIASDFSTNLAAIFEKTYTRLGGHVLATIEYKAESSSLPGKIQFARTYDKADLVFLSGHDESGYIAAKLKENGIHAIPLGSDGWDAESFFTRGGNTITKGYYLSHWLPNQIHPDSLAFKEKLAGYGDVKAATALAYDAVNVLAAALQKAGTDDRTALRNSLSSIKNFHGITGTISFDEQGDAAKNGYLAEIRNGQPKFLKLITD